MLPVQIIILKLHGTVFPALRRVKVPVINQLYLQLPDQAKLLAANEVPADIRVQDPLDPADTRAAVDIRETDPQEPADTRVVAVVADIRAQDPQALVDIRAVKIVVPVDIKAVKAAVPVDIRADAPVVPDAVVQAELRRSRSIIAQPVRPKKASRARKQFILAKIKKMISKKNSFSKRKRRWIRPMQFLRKLKSWRPSRFPNLREK